mgnify:FL=1
MNMVYIWLIVAVLAVVAEAVTVQMVAIWFAPAALVAMLGAIFGAPLALQIVLFVLVSALCVVFLYKKLRKNIAEDCGKTNLDALIGASAKVETEIPQDGVGRVTVKGISWQAACPDGAPKDAHVRVLSIDGVTLNCERIPIPAEQMK